MNLRRTLTWVSVAALGVGLTTAMTITTTLLSQQPIALSSEPLSAGNALAPRTTLVPASAKTVVRHRAKAKLHQRAASEPTTAPVLRTPRASLPSGTQSLSLTHASSGTQTPTVVNSTVARKPKRVVRSGSSGDQGNQGQEGTVQSRQDSADD